MKVELRAIKVLDRNSDETTCFEALLFVDGKARGHVTNDGHGGCHDYSDRKVRDELNAFAATLERLQEFKFEQGDQLVDEMVHAFLVERDLIKAMKKRILFVKAGKVYETKVLPKEQIAKLVADVGTLRKVLRVSDDAAILNTLPLPEALKIYSAQAAA